MGGGREGETEGGKEGGREGVGDRGRDGGGKNIGKEKPKEKRRKGEGVRASRKRGNDRLRAMALPPSTHGLEQNSILYDCDSQHC